MKRNNTSGPNWDDDLYETDEFFNLISGVLYPSMDFLDYVALSGVMLDDSGTKTIVGNNRTNLELYSHTTESIKQSFQQALEQFQTDDKSELLRTLKAYLLQNNNQLVDHAVNWYRQKLNPPLKNDTAQTSRSNLLVNNVLTHAAVQMNNPSAGTTLFPMFKSQVNLQVLDQLVVTRNYRDDIRQVISTLKEKDQVLFIDDQYNAYSAAKTSQKLSDWQLTGGLNGLTAELLSIMLKVNAESLNVTPAATGIAQLDPAPVALNSNTNVMANIVSNIYHVAEYGRTGPDSAGDVTYMTPQTDRIPWRENSVTRVIQAESAANNYRTGYRTPSSACQWYIDEVVRTHFYYCILFASTAGEPLYVDCYRANQTCTMVKMAECLVQTMADLYRKYTDSPELASIKTTYNQYMSRVADIMRSAQNANEQMVPGFAGESQTPGTVPVVGKSAEDYRMSNYIMLNQLRTRIPVDASTANTNLQILQDTGGFRDTQQLDQQNLPEVTLVTAMYGKVGNAGQIHNTPVDTLLVNYARCGSDYRLLLRGYLTQTIDAGQYWTPLCELNGPVIANFLMGMLDAIKSQNPNYLPGFASINSVNAIQDNLRLRSSFLEYTTLNSKQSAIARFRSVNINYLSRVAEELKYIMVHGQKYPNSDTMPHNLSGFIMTDDSIVDPDERDARGDYNSPVLKNIHEHCRTSYQFVSMIATTALKNMNNLSAINIRTIQNTRLFGSYSQEQDTQQLLAFVVINSRNMRETHDLVKTVHSVYDAKFVSLVWKTVLQCFLLNAPKVSELEQSIDSIGSSYKIRNSAKALTNCLALAALMQLLEFWRVVKETQTQPDVVYRYNRLVQINAQMHTDFDFMISTDPNPPKKPPFVVGAVMYYGVTGQIMNVPKWILTKMQQATANTPLYVAKDEFYRRSVRYSHKTKRNFQLVNFGVANNPLHTAYYTGHLQLLARGMTKISTQNNMLLPLELRLYMRLMLQRQEVVWCCPNMAAELKEYDFHVSLNMLDTQIFKTIDLIHIHGDARTIQHQTDTAHDLIRLAKIYSNSALANVCMALFEEQLGDLLVQQRVTWLNIDSIMTKFNGFYARSKISQTAARQQTSPKLADDLQSELKQFELTHMTGLTNFLNSAILLFGYIYQTINLLNTLVTILRHKMLFMVGSHSSNQQATNDMINLLYNNLRLYELDPRAATVDACNDNAKNLKTFNQQTIDYYSLMLHCCNRYLVIAQQRQHHIKEATVQFLSDCTDYATILDQQMKTHTNILHTAGINYPFLIADLDEGTKLAQVSGMLEFIHLFEHHNTANQALNTYLAQNIVVNRNSPVPTNEPVLYLQPANQYNLTITDYPRTTTPSQLGITSITRVQYKTVDGTDYDYKGIAYGYGFDIDSRVVVIPEIAKQTKGAPIYWFENNTLVGAYNLFYLNYMWKLIYSQANEAASLKKSLSTSKLVVFDQQTRVTANPFETFYKTFLKKYIYFLQKRYDKSYITTQRVQHVSGQPNSFDFTVGEVFNAMSVAFQVDDKNPNLATNLINNTVMRDVVDTAKNNVKQQTQPVRKDTTPLVSHAAPTNPRLEQEIQNMVGGGQTRSDAEALKNLNNLLASRGAFGNKNDYLNEIVNNVVNTKLREQAQSKPVADVLPQMVQEVNEQYRQCVNLSDLKRIELDAIRSNFVENVTRIIDSTTANNRALDLLKIVKQIFSNTAYFVNNSPLPFDVKLAQSESHIQIQYEDYNQILNAITGYLFTDLFQKRQLVKKLNTLPTLYGQVCQRVVDRYSSHASQYKYSASVGYQLFSEKNTYTDIMQVLFGHSKNMAQDLMLFIQSTIKPNPLKDTILLNSYMLEEYFTVFQNHVMLSTGYLDGLFFYLFIAFIAKILADDAYKAHQNPTPIHDYLYTQYSNSRFTFRYGLFQYLVNDFTNLLYTELTGDLLKFSADAVNNLENLSRNQTQTRAVETDMRYMNETMQSIRTSLDAYLKLFITPLTQYERGNEQLDEVRMKLNALLASVRNKTTFTESEIQQLLAEHATLNASLANNLDRFMLNRERVIMESVRQIVTYTKTIAVLYNCQSTLLTAFAGFMSQINKQNLMLIKAQQDAIRNQTQAHTDMAVTTIVAAIRLTIQKTLYDLSSTLFNQAGLAGSNPLQYLNDLTIAGYGISTVLGLPENELADLNLRLVGSSKKGDAETYAQLSETYNQDLAKKTHIGTLITLLSKWFILFTRYFDKTKVRLLKAIGGLQKQHAESEESMWTSTGLNYGYLIALLNSNKSDFAVTSVTDVFLILRLLYQTVDHPLINNLLTKSAGIDASQYPPGKVRQELEQYITHMNDIIYFRIDDYKYEHIMRNAPIARDNPAFTSHIQQLDQKLQAQLATTQNLMNVFRGTIDNVLQTLSTNYSQADVLKICQSYGVNNLEELRQRLYELQPAESMQYMNNVVTSVLRDTHIDLKRVKDMLSDAQESYNRQKDQISGLNQRICGLQSSRSQQAAPNRPYPDDDCQRRLHELRQLLEEKDNERQRLLQDINQLRQQQRHYERDNETLRQTAENRKKTNDELVDKLKAESKKVAEKENELQALKIVGDTIAFSKKTTELNYEQLRSAILEADNNYKGLIETAMKTSQDLANQDEQTSGFFSGIKQVFSYLGRFTGVVGGKESAPLPAEYAGKDPAAVLSTLLDKYNKAIEALESKIRRLQTDNQYSVGVIEKNVQQLHSSSQTSQQTEQENRTLKQQLSDARKNITNLQKESDERQKLQRRFDQLNNQSNLLQRQNEKLTSDQKKFEDYMGQALAENLRLVQNIQNLERDVLQQKQEYLLLQDQIKNAGDLTPEAQTRLEEIMKKTQQLHERANNEKDEQIRRLQREKQKVEQTNKQLQLEIDQLKTQVGSLREQLERDQSDFKRKLQEELDKLKNTDSNKPSQAWVASLRDILITLNREIANQATNLSEKYNIGQLTMDNLLKNAKKSADTATQLLAQQKKEIDELRSRPHHIVQPNPGNMTAKDVQELLDEHERLRKRYQTEVAGLREQGQQANRFVVDQTRRILQNQPVEEGEEHDKEVRESLRNLGRQFANERASKEAESVEISLTRYAGPKTTNPGNQTPARVNAERFFLQLCHAVATNDSPNFRNLLAVCRHQPERAGFTLPAYFSKTLQTFQDDYTDVWTPRDLAQSTLEHEGQLVGYQFNMIRFRKPKIVFTNYHQEFHRLPETALAGKSHLPYVAKLDIEDGQAYPVEDLKAVTAKLAKLDVYSTVSRILSVTFDRLETGVLVGLEQAAELGASRLKEAYLKLVYSFIRRCHARCVSLLAQFMEQPATRTLAVLDAFVKRLVWLLSVRPSISAVVVDSATGKSKYYVDYRMCPLEAALAMTIIMELCVQWGPVETRVAPRELIKQYYARYMVWSMGMGTLHLPDKLVRWVWSAIASSDPLTDQQLPTVKRLIARLPAYFAYVASPRLFDDMEFYYNTQMSDTFQSIQNMLGLNYNQLYVMVPGQNQARPRSAESGGESPRGMFTEKESAEAVPQADKSMLQRIWETVSNPFRSAQTGSELEHLPDNVKEQVDAELFAEKINPQKKREEEEEEEEEEPEERKPGLIANLIPSAETLGNIWQGTPKWVTDSMKNVYESIPMPFSGFETAKNIYETVTNREKFSEALGKAGKNLVSILPNLRKYLPNSRNLLLTAATAAAASTALFDTTGPEFFIA